MTMPTDLNLIDRLRIERAVWSLDQRLYELPRRSRVASRRELRANLVAAARDVGAKTAVRDVGDPGALAADYLDAELGPGLRHSWMAAGVFLMTTTLVLTSLLFDAAEAFREGLLAGDAPADGTFTWSGVAYLQREVTYTAAGGDITFSGGAFSMVTWALLLLGAVAVGRLWRATPMWRQRHAR
jgi:hypothetical protein